MRHNSDIFSIFFNMKICCVLIEGILMSTVHTIYNVQYHPKLSQICSHGLFSKGLKNEFETAVVNKPSMLCLLRTKAKIKKVELLPLKVYPFT